MRNPYLLAFAAHPPIRAAEAARAHLRQRTDLRASGLWDRAVEQFALSVDDWQRLALADRAQRHHFGGEPAGERHVGARRAPRAAALAAVAVWKKEFATDERELGRASRVLTAPRRHGACGGLTHFASLQRSNA